MQLLRDPDTAIGRSLSAVLKRVSRFRPVPWEVEALEPDELQRLVLAAVDPYIDRGVLAQQIAREERQRRALEGFRRSVACGE
ncbi:hypothetical protein [Streptomyces sp. RTGN2]|uniref:hypothetical protein n=1 Tax=Streptomyces sp. RTGN2 TaxID=3016525 RepID=UPI0025533CBE|nr:hypothetical protein [Streptomyces sp. RTGN2]